MIEVFGATSRISAVSMLEHPVIGLGVDRPFGTGNDHTLPLSDFQVSAHESLDFVQIKGLNLNGFYMLYLVWLELIVWHEEFLFGNMVSDERARLLYLEGTVSVLNYIVPQLCSRNTFACPQINSRKSSCIIEWIDFFDHIAVAPDRYDGDQLRIHSHSLNLLTVRADVFITH
jgi:hypothetical protein